VATVWSLGAGDRQLRVKLSAVKAMQQGAAHALSVELTRRGWNLEREEGRIKASMTGWPVQVYVLIHFGDEDSASVMAVVIDISAMPLAGERFRDVFNADKHELLRGFGHFRVRQLLKSGAWAPEMGDRAFHSGLNPGIRLATRLVMIDTCPVESGNALAIRFIAESGRFVETGNLIGAALDRLYLPTVLTTGVEVLELPEMVPVGMPPLNQEPGPSHPWLR
jgi:hypothetical protein